MLMALGMFLFDLPTLAHDELQRRASWRHARAARVGARDATQFVGPGEETISLSGAVYAEITDGRVSIEDLRTMAASGEAWPLLDGTGTNHVCGNHHRLQAAQDRTGGHLGQRQCLAAAMGPDHDQRALGPELGRCLE